MASSKSALGNQSKIETMTTIMPINHSMQRASSSLNRCHPSTMIFSSFVEGEEDNATLSLGRAGSALRSKFHHATSPSTTATGDIGQHQGESSVGGNRTAVALNPLNLDHLDFCNLDPVVAQKMLDEIHQGADIKTMLEKIRILSSSPSNSSSSYSQSYPLRPFTHFPPLDPSQMPHQKEKVVTFEDEAREKDSV